MSSMKRRAKRVMFGSCPRRPTVPCLALAIAVFACSNASAAVAPITPAACKTMHERHVIGSQPVIPCDRLTTVTFSYIDFLGRVHDDGQVVVMDVLGEDVDALFKDLLSRRFPIAKAVPIEAYSGDDDASMADDNTSAYNDRNIAHSPSRSVHAYGAAIDVNPIENPDVDKATGAVSPP